MLSDKSRISKGNVSISFLAFDFPETKLQSVGFAISFLHKAQPSELAAILLVQVNAQCMNYI